MKKHITLALGLAVLSGSAFASKARLEALGEEANGSMFLSDNRNVFLNAATLNYHKDLVTFEWGNTASAVDSAQTPRGEGGAFKSSGNMVYGLYFGNESNTSNALRASAMGADVVLEQNNVDFFIAGDAGVQWGASVTYSNSKDEATGDAKQSATRVNLGVISGDIEAFANIGLTNKAERNDAEFDGKSSYDVGATYNMSDVALMARVQAIQAENAGGDEYKTQNYRVGAAKTYKLNDKATMWADAWYLSSTTEDFAGNEEKSQYLPLGIALEVIAKDWLALRASVSQDVLISEEEDDAGDKATRSDTTIVRAGASLLFGDLTIDGMIGNTNTNGVAATDTDADATNAGVLRTDALMSRVSMTYRF